MRSPHSPRKSPSSHPILLVLSSFLVIAGLVVAPAASARVMPDGSLKSAPALAVDTNRVEPGVVRIDTTLQFQGATGSGTGVVLSPDGIVLTNNHVIRGADTITVTNVGNGQAYPADVLGYDRKNDIAVLQLRGATNLPVTPTADSSGLQIGDAVTAIGFPEGGGLTSAPGTVRALDQSIVANDELTGSVERLSGLIDVDVNVRSGNSGGPLVNPAGDVVGIVTASSQTYQMVSTGGFAIPLNRALPIVDAIRSGNGSGSIHVGPTAILGVGIANAGNGFGVLIDSVLRGSPAEQAGLTGGDVITAIDATPVGDGTVLTDVLDRRRPGDTVILTYVDGEGNARNASVTLAPGPPN